MTSEPKDDLIARLEGLTRERDEARRYSTGTWASQREADYYAVENARLRAENEKLREALKPFSDISGEGDEDFPDDTKVVVTFGRSTVYTLKLGDLRRARNALGGKGE